MDGLWGPSSGSAPRSPVPTADPVDVPSFPVRPASDRRHGPKNAGARITRGRGGVSLEGHLGVVTGAVSDKGRDLCQRRRYDSLKQEAGDLPSRMLSTPQSPDHLAEKPLS